MKNKRKLKENGEVNVEDLNWITDYMNGVEGYEWWIEKEKIKWIIYRLNEKDVCLNKRMAEIRRCRIERRRNKNYEYQPMLSNHAMENLVSFCFFILFYIFYYFH